MSSILQRYALVHLVLLSAASASVTVSLEGGAPSSMGSNVYQYTYNIGVHDTTLQNGDFVKIYDFYGYMSDSVKYQNEINWAADDAATVSALPSSAASGNSAVASLVWVYNGPTVLAQSTPFTVGSLTASSNFRYAGALMAGGIDTTSSINYYGRFDALSFASPEPSSAILAIVGLAILGIAAKRKHRIRT